MGKRTWTDEQFEELKRLYVEGKTCDEIAITLNKAPSSVRAKLLTWNNGEKPIRKNNTKFTAIYQAYDWCYDHYITKGMTYKEMASECGASPRVIQKWCSEKHGLNEFTFKEYKILSDKQYMIIISGTLGDGHIDRRPDYASYIESHAEDERDYLFWKYSLLKDCCASSPKEIKAKEKIFNGKKYLCQKEYRFQTRAINQLKEIREMNKITKINKLDSFGLALYLLDDGHRANSWELCVASLSKEEKDCLTTKCKEEFNLNVWIGTDDRYIRFDANSSRIIDAMILQEIPNELDVIKKKITQNNKILNPIHPIWIITNDKRIGLGTYCRNNHFNYESTKKIITELNLTEITEDMLLKEM